ncbi:hypothetical protein HanIR_Chr03g0102131 [Helianthus annuus]|nr:hypothetical protein HanIR_Chr03g0102131 [Helianthus annuus]
MVKNTLQYRSQTCMYESESIVYEIVVLQDFRFRFVSILKIVELIIVKHILIFIIKLFMMIKQIACPLHYHLSYFFTKTISVDFLRKPLTRQLACNKWESENTLLRVCFPHNYQHISGFNLRND